jgi:hypothetical protein
VLRGVKARATQRRVKGIGARTTALGARDAALAIKGRRHGGGGGRLASEQAGLGRGGSGAGRLVAVDRRRETRAVKAPRAPRAGKHGVRLDVGRRRHDLVTRLAARVAHLAVATAPKERRQDGRRDAVRVKAFATVDAKDETVGARAAAETAEIQPACDVGRGARDEERVKGTPRVGTGNDAEGLLKRTLGRLADAAA